MEPDFDAEDQVEVPTDYHVQDAGNGGPPARSWHTPSAAERARVEQDPVVRQALELFDGILIDVRRGPLPAVASPKPGETTSLAEKRG